MEKSAESLIKTYLLNHPSRTIPFDAIKYHIGGFEDDHLRRMLVSCKALRVADNNDVECWVLARKIRRREKKLLIYGKVDAVSLRAPTNKFLEK